MNLMMMVMENRIASCIKCWPIIRAGQKAGKGICVSLQFDQANDMVHVSTYSPHLQDKNYYDTDTYGNKDEFSLSLDLKPRVKKVETDYFECNVYTNEELGKREQVKSGIPLNSAGMILNRILFIIGTPFWKTALTAKRNHRSGSSRRKRDISSVARPV